MYYKNQYYKKSDILISTELRGSCDYVSLQAEWQRKNVTGSSRQNPYSFIKKVCIRNNSNVTLKNLKVIYSITPNLIKIGETNISTLQQRKTTEINSLIYEFEPLVIYSLLQNEEAMLKIELFDEENELIVSNSFDFEFLKISNALKISRIDDLLGSYVTPNDDRLNPLYDEARHILKEKYDCDDFNAYEYRDPNKVIEQLDAIYVAMSNFGFVLNLGTLSFEKYFDSISLPGETFSQRSGNELEIALLFASLVERVGLTPMILFTKETCLFGCWLENGVFSPAKLDNSSYLDNMINGQIKLNLIDTSGISLSNKCNFVKAQENAIRKFDSGNKFRFAIDIRGCRRDHILPIPTKKENSDEIVFPFVTTEELYEIDKIDVGNRRIIKEVDYKKDKVEYWTYKLLDLTLSNGLINCKFHKKDIQIINFRAEELVDFLKTKNTFDIRYHLFENDDLDENTKLIYFQPSVYYKEYKAGINAGDLVASARNNNPDASLKNINKKSKSAQEENGCNPLYLAIGMVKWYETEKAALNGSGELYAPILLLQLDSNRNRIDGKYRYNYDISDLTINQTMIEFFYQKHEIDLRPILASLKQRDEGNVLDIRSVFNYIREQIQIKKGWAVLDNVATINNFSFASNAMWNDLIENKEKLREHPIVNSLITGEKHWEDPENLVKANSIDEELEFNDIALPLPADSSQIEAVSACAEGASFVLDGPPGTGKSQTIANMITNCMYKGKKVLFVAQKAVALDVVKKRLDDIGLGQFCFYAPSLNKSKRDTLSTISSLFDVGPLKDTDEFDVVSNQAKEEKEYLNEILERLHDKEDYFISPYDGIVGFLNSKKYFRDYEIPDEYIKTLTEEKFEQTKELILELERLDKENNGYYNNVFLPLRNIDYSLEMRNKLTNRLDLLPKELDLLHMYSYNCFFKSKGLYETKKNVQKYVRIVEILQKNSDIYEQGLKEDAFLDNIEEAHKFLNVNQERSKIYDELLLLFNPSVLKLKVDELLEIEGQYDNASFLAKCKYKKSLIKTFKAHAKETTSFKFKDVRRYIAKLQQIEDYTKDINEFNMYINRFFEHVPLNTEDSVKNAEEVLDRTVEVAKIIRTMDVEKNCTIENIADAISLLSKDDKMLFDNARTNLLKYYHTLQKEFDDLRDSYGFDVNYYHDDTNYFEKIAGLIREFVSLHGMAGAWVNLLKQLKDCEALVPNVLIRDYENGSIEGADLLDTYLASVYFKYLAIVLSERNIATLRNSDTDTAIMVYEDLLHKHSRLSVIKAAAKITESYPSNAAGQAKSTEAYKLNKIANNGGRGMSLRNILNDYGDLVLNLCPCFLMSPTAVSNLLDVDKFHFDVVIFDEASQIPTHEAISSILRADSVVIAGDQQQMPPSNFFKSNVDDDNYGDINWLNEDLESLLDDSIVLGLPRKRLTWHYRSRHESLIAFSNNQFYDNSLLTFPSPRKEQTAVSFNFVNGTYENKRSVNKTEARKIVNELHKRLKDNTRDESIGIVTFNKSQQNLIENEIDKLFAKHPKLNRYPGGEPIFVKNLENVQGDERDVILFSVCYGINKKTNKLSHNFGPLSRDKGERRLNVAITRARNELIVYSSIKPGDIHPEKTKYEGAQYLQDFLTFAMIGSESLVNKQRNVICESTESATTFIAEDLRKLGYVVEENVGVSSFKIDLVVYDPNDSETGLLGILTDGNSYVNSPTCRDRNIVEPTALERLGWHVYRVWSVEYYDHPHEVIKSIINSINSVKAKRITGNSEKEDPIVFQKSNPSTQPNAIEYRKKEKEQLNVDWNSNLASLTILNWLRVLVGKEAPICKTLVLRRIREESYTKRLTANYKNKINQAITQMEPFIETCGGEPFYWTSEEQAKSYKFYRLNNDEMERDLTQISFIEIGNVIYDILLVQGKMTEMDLYKEVCEVYGQNTLREKNRKYLTKALNANVDHRLNISKADGFVFLRQKPLH